MGTGRGISLIDMVLIIMILAVLAAVAIPKYIDTRYRAKQEAAMNVLKAVRSAIKDHHDNSAKKGEAGFPVIGARADDLVGNTRTSIFPCGKLPSSPVYGNSETGHGPGSVIAAATTPSVGQISTRTMRTCTTIQPGKSVSPIQPWIPLPENRGTRSDASC